MLFWESGRGKKLGADFGFKTQQQDFGGIRKFLVNNRKEMNCRSDRKKKKMAHSDFSKYPLAIMGMG